MSDEVDGKIKNNPRLEALFEYQVLNSLPESDFDSITRLATYLCVSSAAIISFLDEEFQYVKSQVGFKIGKFPITDLFGQFTIQSTEILEIKDTLKDKKDFQT